jgi:N,N'-diacetyllegionaminate synthase
MNSISSNKCLIIADVAQAHDGSLGFAHAYIDAAAKVGVDAIKFQTHIAEEESSPQEEWRIKFSKQDSSRYAYWKRMEFTEDQWLGLKTHADEKNLMFLSSPFSLKAFNFLNKLELPYWKIASGEVSNLPLIDAMIGTKKHLLVSTGMSTFGEIELLLNKIRKSHDNFTLLQCTSKYPCPAESIGLNLLSDFAKKFNCPVGLSDHSGQIYPGLAAVTLGASVLEVHITLSHDMFGPDVSSSLDLVQLKQLIEGVRYIEKMINNPVDKDSMSHDLSNMRKLFQKSLVTTRDIRRGEVFSPDNIGIKKPAIGLPASSYNLVIGKKSKRDLSPGTFLLEDFIDEVKD